MQSGFFDKRWIVIGRFFLLWGIRYQCMEDEDDNASKQFQIQTSCLHKNKTPEHQAEQTAAKLATPTRALPFQMGFFNHHKEKVYLFSCTFEHIFMEYTTIVVVTNYHHTDSDSTHQI